MTRWWSRSPRHFGSRSTSSHELEANRVTPLSNGGLPGVRRRLERIVGGVPHLAPPPCTGTLLGFVTLAVLAAFHRPRCSGERFAAGSLPWLRHNFGSEERPTLHLSLPPADARLLQGPPPCPSRTPPLRNSIVLSARTKHVRSARVQGAYTRRFHTLSTKTHARLVQNMETSRQGACWVSTVTRKNSKSFWVIHGYTLAHSTWLLTDPRHLTERLGGLYFFWRVFLIFGLRLPVTTIVPRAFYIIIPL